MSVFCWPWQYDFPPFFTLQPNQSTRDKQLDAWASLILDYCQHHKLYTLDILEAHASPLFNNSKLNRRLPLEGVLAVVELLEKRKHLEWTDKGKKRCHILWRTAEEWGKVIYDYVVANGMLNSVCTLYELIQGDDTVAESFHDLDKDILLKALRHLQSQGHCQLLSTGGADGVKFF